MPLSDFQPVIGLEVHAQLLTASKLFCGASTQFGGAPNAHTQAYCLGLPGVLPVLNERVVTFAIRTGLALGCTVNPTSEWSRKQYFYPDLPKGYQITQYEHPICEHGEVRFSVGGLERRNRVRRIHLEEDAGKSVHDAGGGVSLVDLNRAGTPLLEIVSEPDLRTSDEAVEYLKALREILVYLGVNDGNLEEGSFRCDANVSVMRKDSEVFGTRCELKNLNSFRFVKQAIDHEIARQVELIEAGGRVAQETRLWDAQRGETRSMRGKEDARDYRYFPDPDLPLLEVDPLRIEAERARLPELPRTKRRRYVEVLNLPEYDAGVLTADRAMAELYERCVEAFGDAKKVSNWFMGELSRLLKEQGMPASAVRFSPDQLAALLRAVDAGALSSNAAKEVFGIMFREGRPPDEVIRERGLGQETDGAAIEAAVDAVLAANAQSVASYKAGKVQLLGSFVGQVMKSMRGKGNPKVISELLLQKLSR
jgi:aspartyl-tRNA(Asn)/glutamyl-tRNA(Gln) amidotransferase subunit B